MVFLDLDCYDFLTMAAGEEVKDPHTVKWNARGSEIEVYGRSALRSEIFKSYSKSGSFDKKDLFYLDWAAIDVHTLLDGLRDSPMLDSKNMSENVKKLADYLVIDGECNRVEKEKNVAILISIAEKVRATPERFRYLSDSRYIYSCETLIPKNYPLGELLLYLDDASVAIDVKGTWNWVNKYGDKIGLWMLYTGRK
ncbi:MAG: hypothetical protein Hyperionvirus1_128 [Hyperionvirus sp.]|uniref:Uncharacterized protein n=1 Tax=Hyperionvirus sp. TaxID=2487770 RepID=A0A3G5AB65_9VIRU|nr:MAG: hypothetical protein Hyperionvirus1_128 [Hyperionvirus sp.]